MLLREKQIMRKMYKKPIIEIEDIRSCSMMQNMNPVSSGGDSSDYDPNQTLWSD